MHLELNQTNSSGVCCSTNTTISFTVPHHVLRRSLMTRICSQHRARQGFVLADNTSLSSDRATLAQEGHTGGMGSATRTGRWLVCSVAMRVLVLAVPRGGGELSHTCAGVSTRGCTRVILAVCAT